MKKLAFFSLLFIAAMYGGACSKSSTPPPSGSENDNFGWTFSPISMGTINSSLTVNGNTVQLSSILSSANQSKLNYLKGVSLQYNASNITINGLPANTTIKDVTLQTSDNSITPLDLGTVTGTGTAKTFTDNTTLTFLNNICNSLYKHKSIALSTTLINGSQAILGVSIVVTCNATLNW